MLDCDIDTCKNTCINLIKGENMTKTKAKNSKDLWDSIELQYKNWTIKKLNCSAKQWEVYDQNNVQHRTLFRDIKTVEQAIQYIEEITNN
jgi:hypothetical protein|tara:strand:+ start:302 stop:571 length:270 start_codon:yes stop_codon:yes gene_type:complete